MPPHVPTAPEPEVHDATIFVERQYPGRAPEGESEILAVHTFVTKPATVTAKVGHTMNLGDYENLRLEVMVSLPCYVEEVKPALEEVSSLAGDFLMQEVASIRDAYGLKRMGS